MQLAKFSIMITEYAFWRNTIIVEYRSKQIEIKEKSEKGHNGKNRFFAFLYN